MMEEWHILVTIGIVAFIVEIFTAGFVAGSVGIGFFVSAIGNYFGLEPKWQIFLFAVGVILTYFLISPIIIKYGYKDSKVKTNKDALIDRTGIVTQEINPLKNTGRVSIDGDDWKALTKTNETIKEGTVVKIVAIDSIILFVEPLN
jgi:membrane protein implicated in regulation of membrane protease activity